MAAVEGPHIARFLSPSAVAAAHSPQEAREEQEVTAARWPRAASANAGFNVMVIPGLLAVVVAAATMVAVAAVVSAGGGGSGYAEPAASNVSSQNGVNSGNGSALICWGYSSGECGSRHRQ